jgi:DNA-binding response OmpR family regulator
MANTFAEDLTNARSLNANNASIYLPEGSPSYSFANNRIEVVPDEWLVRKDDELVEFTDLEFQILSNFAQNPGRLLRSIDIRDTIWGSWRDGMSDNILQVCVSNIRKKLGRDDLGDPKYGAIQTVRGVGYRAAKSLKPRPKEDIA